MADSDSDVKPVDVCWEHIPSFRRETDKQLQVAWVDGAWVTCDICILLSGLRVIYRALVE